MCGGLDAAGAEWSAFLRSCIFAELQATRLVSVATRCKHRFDLQLPYESPVCTASKDERFRPDAGKAKIFLNSVEEYLRFARVGSVTLLLTCCADK